MNGFAKTASVENEKLLNEKLAEIVHHAEMMTGASGAAIALKDGDSLVTQASTGTTAPDIGSRSRIRGSFTGLVIETGEPVRCDDSDNDHRVDPAVCRALQTRSIVVVPVRVDNAVTGVLAVFASSPHSFSNVHVSAIKTLAEIAGDIIAKYLPANEGKQENTAKAEPHLEINRVSLEQPPVQVEEFQIDVVEEDPLPALSPAEISPVHMIEPEPVLTAQDQVEVKPIVAVEPDRKFEAVIGPGSLSQSPSIPTATGDVAGAQIIPLPTPTKQFEPTAFRTVGETAKADAPAMVLAMAAAPVPLMDAPKLQHTMKDAPAKEKTEPVTLKKESVLSLADEPVAQGDNSKTKTETMTELAAWDLRPKREFNVWKVAVPLGLAAALAIAGWFYFTKWRHRSANVGVTAVQQAPATNVVDPITAAAQAEPAKSDDAPTGLQNATLNTSAVPKPSAPTRATADTADVPLEPEVVVSEPKPLVVQNAAAVQPLTTTRVAREEAPQVVASATGALPLPVLNVDGKIPKLNAKQSSLVPNQLMKSVQPVYPDTARRLGLSGSVTVEAQIGPDGDVKKVVAVEGEPLLARAAMAAVKQWKYRPSYLNGEPVESTARIVLNFRPQTGQ